MHGGLEIRARLALSYGDLDDVANMMYRRVGPARCPRVELASADAEAALGRLVDARLRGDRPYFQRPAPVGVVGDLPSQIGAKSFQSAQATRQPDVSAFWLSPEAGLCGRHGGAAAKSQQDDRGDSCF